MRRDYKIVHFLKENERSIKKESEEGEFWFGRDHDQWIWTPHEKRAKRFFHKGSAESALVIAKMK